MATDLFQDQWNASWVMSPIVHNHVDTASLEDEWGMWNNGGEL